MSSIKDEVLCAQGRILDSLIDCESRIAALYGKFVAAFPVCAGFWERLVREERQHVQALKNLHRFLDRGQLFHHIGRFNQEELKSLLAMVEKADQSVTSARLDAVAAFTVALKVESSLSESRFYASVTSDAPEFMAVCKVLQTETEEHMARLYAEMAKQKTEPTSCHAAVAYPQHDPSA